MNGLLATVFVASLLGSLHCAGMCGGVVALCVGGRPVASRPAWGPLAAYHVGRLVTYATLGGLSGAVGAAVDFGGSAAGFSRTAAVVAGVLMIVFGATVLAGAAGARLGCVRAPRWMQTAFARGTRLAAALPPARRSAILGLLTGALPCGWLYAFVLTAAGTGHPLAGGLVMVVFWAGTVPILLALGVGLDRLAAPMRRHLPTVTALALVVVGVATVTMRLGAPAYAESIDVDPETLTSSVEALDAAAMPCCRDDDAD